jgi:hypothetical protein
MPGSGSKRKRDNLHSADGDIKAEHAPRKSNFRRVPPHHGSNGNGSPPPSVHEQQRYQSTAAAVMSNLERELQNAASGSVDFGGHSRAMRDDTLSSSESQREIQLHANKAIAALAGLYPAGKIPGISDLRLGSGSEDRNLDPALSGPEHDSSTAAEVSFIDKVPPPPPPPQVPGGGQVSSRAPPMHRPLQEQVQQKPAVGTPEWTRMRKDNHKEGMFCLIVSWCNFQTVQLLTQTFFS